MEMASASLYTYHGIMAMVVGEENFTVIQFLLDFPPFF